jgi:hypothetical protein
MPVENFCGALKQKVMTLFLRIVTGDEIWVHYHQPEGVASFLITKTRNVLDEAICREDYDDSLLG